MEKYQIQGEKFIINDYQNAKRFSSFLPAVAGEDGKPTWVFYANVGQCVGGFGIYSKDYPMTPFDSAFLAYQNIPLKSFRTFVKVDDKYLVEPFNTKDECSLTIERSNITIKSSNEYFDIVVVYSTISHQPYPGLIRKVTIKSKGQHSLRIVDGLPIYLPKGADNYAYHELTTLVAAYCQVEISNGVPYLRYTNRGGDEAKVVIKEDGNSFISVDKNNYRLSPLVDLSILFKQDDSLANPLGFDDCFAKDLDQSLSNQIPCAFSIGQAELKDNEEYSFISLFSSFDKNKECCNTFNSLNYDFLNKQISITSSLVDSLLPEIKTSDDRLNEYLKQCFLDNGLRGGFPIQKDDKTLYLYSRKHGDMERDYNAFNIPSTYYSSGLGNYRDINQNRRNDLYLNPDIKDLNVYLFNSLIEANGFNPLLVDVSLLKVDYKSFEEATSVIDKLDLSNIQAKYVEGYWTDHFAYNLDLIENYLSIYPDKLEELLFTKKYKFFDSHIRIKPRNERYVLLDNDEIRQYNCLEPIKGLTSNWLLDKNNKEVEVDLASKLAHLIIIKCSSLDVNQLGLEMFANKPGWNDSCNGLPGLFGSSMNETIELLRLVSFYLDSVSKFDKDIFILKPLKSLLMVMISDEPNGFKYWDVVNTAREAFEDSYRNSELVSLKSVEIKDAFIKIQTILRDAIKRAISLNNGVIPTYFTQKVEKYHLDNGVVVESFKTSILPNFLEAPARALKLGKDYFDSKQIELVNKSDLLDKELLIYKTSTSLDKQSKELGRICSFNPGWLERESDFLHMTFKYLLGLLKAGYYEEFFNACKNNLPCYMKPQIYGRSIFENVSFIAPSNHINKKLHGQGFYARLTGANTEVINMVYLLCFGETLFSYNDHKLSFRVTPHIPLSLFKDDEIKISLFKDISITFINKNHRDYEHQDDLEYLIDGQTYKIVPNDISIKIRNREVRNIKIIIF